MADCKYVTAGGREGGDEEDQRVFRIRKEKKRSVETIQLSASTVGVLKGSRAERVWHELLVFCDPGAAISSSFPTVFLLR